jgi:hypothetical protein
MWTSLAARSRKSGVRSGRDGKWQGGCDPRQRSRKNKPQISVVFDPGHNDLPFVISTGAQRSGEICGSVVQSWKCLLGSKESATEAPESYLE